MNFKSYVKAGYSLLWVQTTEEKRVVESLSRKMDMYNCYKWDIVRGMSRCNGEAVDAEILDPISMMNAIPSCPDKSIIFVLDFQKFCKDITVVRN